MPGAFPRDRYLPRDLIRIRSSESTFFSTIETFKASHLTGSAGCVREEAPLPPAEGRQVLPFDDQRDRCDTYIM